jgi:hypothetical protein
MKEEGRKRNTPQTGYNGTSQIRMNWVVPSRESKFARESRGAQDMTGIQRADKREKERDGGKEEAGEGYTMES